MNKNNLTEALKALPAENWQSDAVDIQPIQDDDDLWYTIVECRLHPEQEAGFVKTDEMDGDDPVFLATCQ